jgi:hypothetical protein
MSWIKAEKPEPVHPMIEAALTHMVYVIPDALLPWFDQEQNDWVFPEDDEGCGYDREVRFEAGLGYAAGQLHGLEWMIT